MSVLDKEWKSAEEVLQAGLEIRLQVNAFGKGAWILGQIHDLFGGRLSVSLAARDFRKKPQTGTKLVCMIAGEGCAYQFPGEYLDCVQQPERLWYFRRPEMVQRVQMRRYVRVAADLKLSVRLPGDRGSLRDPQDLPLVDLSGGGLCFVSEKKVPLLALLQVDIQELPQYGRLTVLASVRRCRPVQTASGEMYYIGVSFEGMLSAQEQERLIQSVFALQRLQLQRTLPAELEAGERQETVKGG